MSYIAELIKNECPECQPERVAVILARNGVTHPTKEYHYDIYKYFVSRLTIHEKEKTPLTKASIDTMDKFNISRFTLLRIRNEF